MFKQSDRYVFIEWLKIFALVLGAMFGLQFIVEVQDSFAELMGYDAGFGQILFYYIIKAPSFLTFTLPAAILVSVLYALGQLHRNNEFVAFRSTGMSVFRVTRTIWFSGLALSIGLWHLNANFIPWSVEQSRTLWNNLEYTHQAKNLAVDQVGIVKNLSFDNRKDGRMWFMNRFSNFTNEAYGVTMTELNDNRIVKRRIMAKQGYYDDIDHVWVLEQGLDNEYAISGEDAGEVVRSIRFDRLELQDIDDNPDLMMLLDKRPKDLSFLELNRLIDNFDRDDNAKIIKYEVRLQSLIAGAASCLIVVGIAIPFATSGVRVNPAVGVSKSIGLFFIYYILASVLNALGRQEIISPVTAAWLPNGFMILLAYVLMRRVR
ncbi:LptF/LptG family permease [Puniceicoccaceae bacterium K14]|nr:LptF/LptG family permease [Puniceicoccaceae bacterium K14]